MYVSRDLDNEIITKKLTKDSRRRHISSLSLSATMVVVVVHAVNLILKERKKTIKGSRDTNVSSPRFVVIVVGCWGENRLNLIFKKGISKITKE